MIFRVFALLALAASALTFAQPASAAWHRAESDRFVIYADDSEKDILEFAANLERYHRAMEIITGRTVAPPSPSNRVVIFAVGGQRDLRRVLDTRSRTIAGIYIPRAGGSRAYVQDIRNRTGGSPHFSMVVLLHEYAHHFLISSSRFAMPRWMSEGAAEFFASTTFERDGSIAIGLPAKHRGGELMYANPVSVHELLDAQAYQNNRRRGYDAFYGRSWLLYHYLSFNDERKGQLPSYWLALQRGLTPLEAGEEVFGDLDELERELNVYMRSRRMQGYRIAAQHLPIGQITIERLSRGEAEVMSVRMVSQRGVDDETALELVEEAREIAADYPNDAGVLAALAEAEYDAGNDAQAIAAADAAIAIDPGRANPYVQKAYALFRQAQDAEDIEPAIAQAMRPLEALNALENDHPIPLIYYYRSFVERGVEPPENARAALERAAVLAPFDKGLWLQVAAMQAGEGKIDLARASLEPLAANPHGGSIASASQLLLELLKDAPEGEPMILRPNFSGGDEDDGVVPGTPDPEAGSDGAGDDAGDSDGDAGDDESGDDS